jgi:hypothetical protein
MMAAVCRLMAKTQIRARLFQAACGVAREDFALLCIPAPRAATIFCGQVANRSPTCGRAQRGILKDRLKTVATLTAPAGIYQVRTIVREGMKGGLTASTIGVELRAR